MWEKFSFTLKDFDTQPNQRFLKCFIFASTFSLYSRFSKTKRAQVQYESWHTGWMLNNMKISHKGNKKRLLCPSFLTFCRAVMVCQPEAARPPPNIRSALTRVRWTHRVSPLKRAHTARLDRDMTCLNILPGRSLRPAAQIEWTGHLDLHVYNKNLVKNRLVDPKAQSAERKWSVAGTSLEEEPKWGARLWYMGGVRPALPPAGCYTFKTPPLMFSQQLVGRHRFWPALDETAVGTIFRGGWTHILLVMTFLM